MSGTFESREAPDIEGAQSEPYKEPHLYLLATIPPTFTSTDFNRGLSGTNAAQPISAGLHCTTARKCRWTPLSGLQ